MHERTVNTALLVSEAAGNKHSDNNVNFHEVIYTIWLFLCPDDAPYSPLNVFLWPTALSDLELGHGVLHGEDVAAVGPPQVPCGQLVRPL